MIMITTEIKSFSCDRFVMDYARFGSGSRCFVIIPGMSVKSVLFSADAIAAAFSMFAEDHTVYVFDRVKDMPDIYTVNDMAEDTAEAMTGLGIEKADIYGASQGGMIALAIAVSHPSLVNRLVLASTQARPNTTSDATMDEWMRLCQETGPECLNHDVFTKVYSQEYYTKYERAFARLESGGTPEEIRRFRILARATKDFDIYGHLGEISCPTLVTGSEKDMVLSSAGAAEIAGVLKCKLHLYKSEGHAAYDEDPEFPSMIHDFLIG